MNFTCNWLFPVGHETGKVKSWWLSTSCFFLMMFVYGCDSVAISVVLFPFLVRLHYASYEEVTRDKLMPGNDILCASNEHCGYMQRFAVTSTH